MALNALTSINDDKTKKAVIPLKNFSDYWLENMAINGHNQLQITSACDAKCAYCSNESNAFETLLTKFRDIKEIEKVLYATNYIDGPIVLNESLPGRISEGEALIHPKFFDILGLIRRKFNNPIAITTSGSRLTPENIEKISHYLPFEVTMSLPSINKEYWTKLFKLKDRHYDNAINSFELMRKHGISVGVNMTPMPSYVGYEDIENTIKFVAQNNIKRIYIFAPGYTKYTPPDMVEKMIYDKEEMSKFFVDMSIKYDIHIDWPLDPNGMLYISYDSILDILKSFHRNGTKRSFWFTSTSAIDRFHKKMVEFTRTIPHQVSVVEVKNYNYGGNIEAAGLWVIKDIEETVEKLNLHGERIVFPGIFLDKYGFDLNGDNILDFYSRNDNIFYKI
jgi:MoaA/NifB/PqqE/SkfB family radical SAM enzyme